MRWCPILEEFGPDPKNIKGENNAAANTISWLNMSDKQEILNIYELYGYYDYDMPDIAYPISYRDIYKAHNTDAKLQQNLVSHK